MLRRKTSILTTRSVSFSISQVSPSPNPSSSSCSSSQHPLLHLKKSLPLIRPQPWWSFSTAAASQRFDFAPESDPHGSRQQKPTVFDSRSSSQSQVNWGYSQQNPHGGYREKSSGYQKTNLGEASPMISDGFRRENTVGPGYQRNNLEELQMNQRSNFPVQNRVGEFQRGGPTFYGQVNQWNNTHFGDTSQNVAENGIGNSHPDTVSGYYGAGNPFQNQGGFYGEHPRDCYSFNWEPQNVYGPKVNYETSAGMAADAGEIITYEDALHMFDEFCEKEKVMEAVTVLGLLYKIGMFMDVERYLKLVTLCGEAKLLDEARIVHDHITLMSSDIGVSVHNRIIDMYSKCGSVAHAYQLFERMPQRNLTSWSNMIMGLANHGFGDGAIDLFTQFKETGLKPDGGLFTAVYFACGVIGDVDQGMIYFKSMKEEFGIVPVMEHYVGIVDMFGRSGYLDEALEFIQKMPLEPDVNVWETLMNFCRVNGYVELGDRCAEMVEQLDPSKVNEQFKMGLLPVKSLKFEKERRRKNNSSLLDCKHQVHEYRSGDRSDPASDTLYALIKCLAQHMKESGYVPDGTCALHDVDQESREEALLYHSERLAIAHGLLNSAARTPIRIIKNLRVCRDCHNACKIISKLVGRLIIARDIKRFHHFENGVCSCKDFW